MSGRKRAKLGLSNAKYCEVRAEYAIISCRDLSDSLGIIIIKALAKAGAFIFFIILYPRGLTLYPKGFMILV